MARTKQTARRSTSELSAHPQLAGMANSVSLPAGPGGFTAAPAAPNSSDEDGAAPGTKRTRPDSMDSDSEDEREGKRSAFPGFRLLNSGLNAMRDSELLIDVVLVCSGGEKIPAHKVVLSAYSPYLKNLFSSGMMEGSPPAQRGWFSAQSAAPTPQVELRDLDAGAMRALVDAAYTGELVISATNVRPLIVTANFLWIEPAEKEAGRYLADNLRVATVLEDLKFASALEVSVSAATPPAVRSSTHGSRRRRTKDRSSRAPSRSLCLRTLSAARRRLPFSG
eukprot:COSAG04_NODE_809_length_10142_cov_3.378174_2_plen_280_part_00